MKLFSKLKHRFDSAKTQADTDYFWSTMARRIAPELIEEYPNHLKVNDVLVKTLVIGLPFQKTDGWPVGLSPAFQSQLLDIGKSEGVTLSISTSLIQIPNHESIDLLEKTQFKNTENMAISRENNPDDSISQYLTIEKTALGRTYEAILTGKERLFHCAFFITIWARSEADMMKAESHVFATVGAHCVLCELPAWRQLDAFLGALPFPNVPEFAWTEMITSYARLLPVLRNPNSRMDDSGLLFGVDTTTGIDVVIDLDRLPAQHAMIVGPTGSGKTYTLLLLLMRCYSLLGKRVVYVTPKADVGTNYRAVADYFGNNASIVDIGPSGQNINPLQILYDEQITGSDLWAAKSMYDNQKLLITTFFKIWFEGTMTPNMDSYLDQTLNQLYRSKGIYRDNPAGWKGAQWPAIADLRRIWEKDAKDRGPQGITAEAMLNKTYQFGPDGRLAYMNRPTSINLSTDFIIVDLSGVPDDIKDAMSVFVTGILGMRFKTDTGRETLIAVDEAAVFFRDPKLSAFLLRLLTQGRSFDIALWLATQQMADLQKADLLEEFKTNVFLNIILGANVKSDTIKILKDYFHLDQTACDALMLASVGEGVLLVDEEVTPVTFRPTELENSIIKGSAKTCSEIQVNRSVARISAENRLYVDSWLSGDYSHALKDNGFEPFRIQKIDGNGTVKIWLDSSLLSDGKVGNQSIDHYCTVCQLGGVLVQAGFEVEINHYDDVDVAARLNGSSIAFEYERPGSHNINELLDKKQRAERDYNRVIFICTAENFNEIKAVVGAKNAVKRGTDFHQLMSKLKEVDIDA